MVVYLVKFCIKGLFVIPDAGVQFVSFELGLELLCVCLVKIKSVAVYW